MKYKQFEIMSFISRRLLMAYMNYIILLLERLKQIQNPESIILSCSAFKKDDRFFLLKI